MDFQEYEKDGVTITATETAYEVIYKAQGFRPKEEKPPEPVQNDGKSHDKNDGKSHDKNDGKKSGTKGGARGGKAGSDPGDHGEGAPAGEAQDA